MLSVVVRTARDSFASSGMEAFLIILPLRGCSAAPSACSDEYNRNRVTQGGSTPVVPSPLKQRGSTTASCFCCSSGLVVCCVVFTAAAFADMQRPRLRTPPKAATAPPQYSAKGGKPPAYGEYASKSPEATAVGLGLLKSIIGCAADAAALQLSVATRHACCSLLALRPGGWLVLATRAA